MFICAAGLNRSSPSKICVAIYLWLANYEISGAFSLIFLKTKEFAYDTNM